ncbi:MAG: alpha/beta hydrolase [Oscillospiraceae bacterium]|nr:alpha/beta hydrolase [Oscillospiraceae bacterium]
MSAKSKKLITAAVILAVVVSVVSGIMVYLCDYYPADDYVQQTMVNNLYASVVEYSDGVIAFEPESEPECGLIFYPGGKVEYTAYSPLMQLLAGEGVLCLLVEMPFNLAVFDSNAAYGLQARYPNVGSWYIGGHSLGGAMAASYASSHTDELGGLILLAAYSTADLSGTSLNVISIYGSEDGVLDRDKYEECKSNLPDNFSEYIIEGGCHAGFGMYGEQQGDGEPTIDSGTQMSLAADFICENIMGGK